ncbi:MAG: hypothetical protein ACF8LL_00175 [Phycisphaerales bacterium]
MRRWIIASFALVFVLGAGIVVAALVVVGRAADSLRAPSVEQAFSIDDAEYRYRTRELSDGSFVVDIVDGESRAVLATSQSANPVMRWFIEEDQGSVWFYSGDIGLSVFVRDADGVWYALELNADGYFEQDQPGSSDQEPRELLVPESVSSRLP